MHYLTPSQFMLAEKFGVSPEEFAKYSKPTVLKRKPKRVGLWVVVNDQRGGRTSLLVTPTANGLTVKVGSPEQ